MSLLITPLVELYRYALIPLPPFTWFGVGISTLDVAATVRLCLLTRQVREMLHASHVATKGKKDVEEKSLVKAMATTLLIVYGGEVFTAPFLNTPPSFMVSGAVPMLYMIVQAIVEYFPSVPTMRGEMELPLSVLDGFTRAYLLCTLVPPVVSEHPMPIIASSPWALLLTSLITTNGGFFFVNLFSTLNPTPMAVQTPPELQANGWMTVDLWSAPFVTGLYALLTHAQPFWGDLHRLMVGFVGGAVVEPTDPEVARVLCTMVLAGLFSSRTVVNYDMWKKPAGEKPVKTKTQ